MIRLVFLFESVMKWRPPKALPRYWTNHPEASFIGPLYIGDVVIYVTHAKKVATSATAGAFLLLLALPFVVVQTDAAAVLDTPQTAGVQIGTILQINAYGEGRANASGAVLRALTSMNLVFEVTQKGQRGALFTVKTGSFVLNSTGFVISEGVGVAGRPEEGRLNGTVVFVFRFNMTGTDGVTTEVTLRGIVMRHEGRAPVLMMRGTFSVGGLTWLLRQSGRIHVINK